MATTANEDTALAAENLTGSRPDSDDIVAKYEEMFASRYTPEDPSYHPYINKGMDPPPVVENYFIRRQRPNWNDSPREQRRHHGGYKRRYDDTFFPEGADRQRGQYDSRDNRHQGRGWGQPQGHWGGNQWGQRPRQDWRERGEPGHRPPGNQGGRRYGDRERGYSSGSNEARHGMQRDNVHQPEWT